MRLSCLGGLEICGCCSSRIWTFVPVYASVRVREWCRWYSRVIWLNANELWIIRQDVPVKYTVISFTIFYAYISIFFLTRLKSFLAMEFLNYSKRTNYIKFWGMSMAWVASALSRIDNRIYVLFIIYLYLFRPNFTEFVRVPYRLWYSSLYRCLLAWYSKAPFKKNKTTFSTQSLRTYDINSGVC